MSSVKDVIMTDVKGHPVQDFPNHSVPLSVFNLVSVTSVRDDLHFVAEVHLVGQSPHEVGQVAVEAGVSGFVSVPSVDHDVRFHLDATLWLIWFHDWVCQYFVSIIIVDVNIW